MSKATKFYDVVDKIEELLKSNEHCNSVSYGDITKVDTNKTSIYPLAHFVVNSAQLKSNTMVFSISIACMDIIDQVKEGTNNEQDIFNTQLAVLSKTLMLLQRVSLRNEGYQLLGEPTLEQFNHRFEDDVAGWDATFEVEVIQEMEVCS
tara:strand:+ start:163 stop:609 length:447 start_codon:yes stop_codon:yes gene_type:complete